MPYRRNPKNLHTAIVTMAISAGLTACSTPYNSGIEEMGPDVYFLQIRTPPGKGGSAASKRQAIAEANEHCAKSGKVAKVTHEDLGPVTADVYFACVDM
jgi:putative hemolysin